MSEETTQDVQLEEVVEQQFETAIDSLIEEPQLKDIQVGVNVMDVEELQALVAEVKTLRELVQSQAEILKTIVDNQTAIKTDVAATQRGVIKFAEHVATRLRSDVAALQQMSKIERQALPTVQTKPNISYVFPEDAPGG